MKNLITRALSGIVFVCVVVGAVWFNAYTFLLLFAFVVGVALFELYQLLHMPLSLKISGVIGGIYVFVASFLYSGGYTSHAIFYPYILYLLGLFIYGLYHKSENPINDWAIAYFAQFYGAGLLCFLNLIVFPISSNPTYIPYFLLLVFALIWLNDTGAYLVGSTIGKHKLFPSISPQKSWEGFWGGLVVALLASQLSLLFFTNLVWYQPLGLALVVVIFGTLGDLGESLIKRTAGVKDSGNILPGHGGILDRFDSLLLAAPAAAIYIDLFIQN